MGVLGVILAVWAVGAAAFCLAICAAAAGPMPQMSGAGFLLCRDRSRTAFWLPHVVISYLRVRRGGR